MALIHCDFFSETLGLSSSMYVILPNPVGKKGGRTLKHPVLYLLHGYSDDHTIWLRKTSIERYVENLGLAVVMPAVNKSFYMDMKHGDKYWTFISKELPRIACAFFPLSDKREDNFAAGLSMGGYGALKLALGCPGKFAAGAGLSGALDLVTLAASKGDIDFSNIFADATKIKGSSNDLFHLAAKVSASDGPKPKLYQCCGTEDFLYRDNIAFRDYCRTLSLDYTYEEEPGEHVWAYWDKKIQSVLEWLPLKGK